MTLEIVIPARNEAAYVTGAVDMLAGVGAEALTVVDNDSEDPTARAAVAAGATVVTEPRTGKGFAAVTGIRSATSRRVFLCDADVRGLRQEMIADLFALAVSTGAPVVRLAIGRSADDAPVTTLTARPMLTALGMDQIAEPLGGLMLVERQFVLEQHLAGGWGFDVGLTIAGLRHAGTVPELSVQGISHRRKPVADYAGMAQEVAQAILVGTGRIEWDHSDCARCAADSDGAAAGHHSAHPRPSTTACGSP
jgi:Glycosyl transferase family 2